MEIVYYVASSLDGYIATPDGGVDWLSRFNTAGQDYGYNEFFASVDAFLVGSRTYEQSLGYPEWPYGELPCYVATSRSLPLPNRHVRLLDGSPEQIVGTLRDAGHRRVWLVGGGALAAAIQDQITEFILSMIPVVLGGGIPLIGPGAGEQALRLTHSMAYASGIVQLRYERL